MAQQIINVGTAPNDGDGDPIRTAFIKCNDNFTDLYGGNGGGGGNTISNGNSNVAISTVDGNATISIDGISNIAVFSTNGLRVNGNASIGADITANYFIGIGANLTGDITGSNINAGNLSLVGNVLGNLAVSDNVTASNFFTTGVMSAAGDVAGGNVLSAGLISGTGNVSGGNILSGGLLSATSNITGGNILTSGLISATSTITSDSNITGGNILTAGTVSATGNVHGTYILGDGGFLSNVTAASNVAATQIANGTSVMSVDGSDGNISTTVAGVSNIAVFSSTGVLVTGLVSATGNVIGGNILTVGAMSATGNITGNYFIGNGSLLTGIAGLGNGLAWTTVANTAPGSPRPGDFWFDSYAGVKYQYVNDGTSNIWVDQSFPTSFTTLTVTENANVGNLLTNGSITATGNATAGNILTAGIMSSTGNAIHGNILTDGLISAAGNIQGGNLSINTGTFTVGNIINGNSNGIGNIGNTSNYFNTVFAKSTSAQYADLAEMFSADKDYPPGTLVEFGGDEEITATSKTHSTQTAGVISTNPSYLMNSVQHGKYVLPVALTGRVPCQVVGIIRKGDRLVSSSIDGVATILDSTIYEPGCIIGKALNSWNSDEIGTIEIVVGRY
jgi:hypothetical protein